MNRVILIGRVGKDPEAGTTTNGTQVAKFSLATSEKYKDNELTEWHTVRCWRSTADFVGKYCPKGSLVSVEGKLRTETWEGRDGGKRSQVIIEADEVKLLARKNEGKPMQTEQPQAGNQYNYNEPEPDEGDLPFNRRPRYSR